MTIKNEKDFSLINEPLEAYKQYCEDTNRLPIKSKNLLIERFNKAWEREKNIFSEKSLETDSETLIQKEIDFTQKEIDTINGRYLGIYPPNTKRIVALPFGENIDDKTHIKSYLKWLKEKVEELSNEKNIIETPPKENLLKWNTSPNHFGYLINELINKGYIENLPMSNGETNYSEIARLFSSIIDFDTTDQYLIKSFNPNNEKISETVKRKFTIPDLIDIKPKNSKTKGTKTKPSETSIKTKKNK